MQQYICVKEHSERFRQKWSRKGITFPIKGTIYTFRWEGILPDYERMNPSVLLYEIHNPQVLYTDNVWREASFFRSHFTEVRSTSIEVFTSMLTKVPSPELVE